MDDVVEVEQTDLREYLRVLRRRRFVIALSVSVVVAVAMAYSYLAKPTYGATATVLVPQQQAGSALNIQNSQIPQADTLQRTLADEQQFAKGDAVKQEAAKRLGYSASISVKSSNTADVLSFSSISGNKARAAAIANAFANAYISARRANDVSQYTQQVTALEKSIANLQAQANASPVGAPERTALQQSIATLAQTVQQTQAASQLASQVGPTVINAAKVPQAPNSPRPTRNGLLGLLVGLLLGVGLAFLVDRLDDGISSREAAEKATHGLPVIGQIPLVPSWRTKGAHHLALIEDPASTVAEAYRTLRTSVQFLRMDNPKQVIGITSSVADEGKTTAVANLAVSFARAGQRVVILSCDLRRPRIHEFFGLSNEAGLTSVLLGEAPLSTALITVENESRLRVLPSGPVPPNPAEILSLNRLGEVVTALAEGADLVLLDCPPVLPVADALLLSRHVDGMILLASAETTSRRSLHASFTMLKQVQTNLLGTIINRVPTQAQYGYHYGYGYQPYNSRGSNGEGREMKDADGSAALVSGSRGSISESLLSPLGTENRSVPNGDPSHDAVSTPSKEDPELSPRRT